jgi:DnaJ-class molecular chaperone with C-terminal Zn finger domain
MAAGYAVLTFLGGTIFLGLTFWIVFMIVKLILLSAIGLSGWVTLGSVAAAAAFCMLLFFDSLRSPRDDMSALSIWLIREYIDIGPRLMLEVVPAIRKFRHWKKFDLDLNGRVLLFLAGRDSPVRKSDVLRLFPETDWDRLRAELKLIPGVIFFQPDELRMTLTLPLRLQMRLFRGRQRVHVNEPSHDPDPEPEPIRPREPQSLSPAEILGVAPNASIAEIKSAYRRRMKECHPDRHATLDEHSRTLAEEWAKSVNAAYNALLSKRGERR